MHYVGFWARVGAYLLDYILCAVFFSALFAAIALILGVSVAFLGTEDESAQMALGGIGGGAFLLIFFASVLYFPVFECSKWRATPGKKLLNMAVVDANGGRIGFWRALWRFICKFFSSLIFFIGYMMIGWNKEKRGLHDYMSGTYVIWTDRAPIEPEPEVKTIPLEQQSEQVKR